MLRVASPALTDLAKRNGRLHLAARTDASEEEPRGRGERDEHDESLGGEAEDLPKGLHSGALPPWQSAC